MGFDNIIGLPGHGRNRVGLSELGQRENSGIASLHIHDHAPKFDNMPVHIEAGSVAQSLEPAERFFKLLNGPAEKTMNKIEGSDHFDLYWKPEYVDEAVDRLDSFYKKYI